MIELAEVIASLQSLTDEDLVRRGFTVEGSFDAVDDPVLIGPDGEVVPPSEETLDKAMAENHDQALMDAAGAKAFEIKATTNVCCATPTQMAVAEYLAQGSFERHIRKVRAVLERQCRMMEQRILAHFPAGTRVSHPSGGTVLWAQLPPPADSIRLFYEAKAKGIGLAPGNIFSSCDQFNGFVRISFGNAWTRAVDDAVAEVGRLAAAQCAQGETGPAD